MTKKRSETLRINMAWKGDELTNLREVQALLRLNDEASAVRYLVARGMEVMSGALGTRRLQAKMEVQFSPQELLPFFEKMAAANGPVPVAPTPGGLLNG